VDPATWPAGYDVESDPYFQAMDVGPAKESASTVGAGERRRRLYRRRMAVFGAVLAVVWLGVLLDPHIAALALFLLVSIGATLGLFVAAMGLGLLGFGLCTAGDRFIGWIRRGSRWPDE
jgi:hypothetical protein